MKVKLLHYTPIWLIANAIRMSRDNHHLSDTVFSDSGELVEFGFKDFDLIKRVGIKMKHESVLEFGYFVWEIDGVSRACLQELARHRMANLTVKSTRYTLRELKNEESFTSKDNFKLFSNKEIEELANYNELFMIYFYSSNIVSRASRYILLTGDISVDTTSLIELEMLRRLITNNKSNDIVKYALPEAFKTKLQWGTNLRAFLNFYKLRSSKDALWEIRKLAENLKESLPLEYQELIELYMEKIQ